MEQIKIRDRRHERRERLKSSTHLWIIIILGILLTYCGMQPEQEPAPKDRAEVNAVRNGLTNELY